MASRGAKAIVRDTVDRLKAMTDCRISGADSGLANVWEEVCALVQGERSVYWAAYLHTINALLLSAVEAMAPEARRKLSPEAGRGQEKSAAFTMDQIVNDLRGQLLTAAGNFFSNNVNRYLER